MTAPSVPRSIFRNNRVEHAALPLHSVGGVPLPPGLSGHLFFMSPAGTVASGGLPGSLEQRSPLFNGDGMIYRFDLGGAVPTVKNRLVRSPCFYADEATWQQAAYRAYRFTNFSLLRAGRLGFRNEGNISFQPMLRPDGSIRLLVTYDAGRPWEIDPSSLEVLTPMGSASEWTAAAFEGMPFAPVFSPAHPCYDVVSGEIFTVNYNKSVPNTLSSLPVLTQISEQQSWVRARLESYLFLLPPGKLLNPIPQWLDYLRLQRHRLELKITQKLEGRIPRDFTFLVRWNGEGTLERWRLMLPSGAPVAITSTLHQLGLTRHYVVLVDVAFKTGLESLTRSSSPTTPALDSLLRVLLSSPQIDRAPVYLVKRSDLNATAADAAAGKLPLVTVQALSLPLEAGHFLVDYDDTGDEIRLIMAHVAASDISEWIRAFDRHPAPPYGIPEDLVGMLAMGQMDLSRISRYVIDAKGPSIRSQKSISDDVSGWLVAFYAARDVGTHAAAPESMPYQFWTSLGFFPELMTRSVYELYEDYAKRLMPLPAMRKLIRGDGCPSTLFRLDTLSMDIGDRYVFPDGHIANTPQFIPCSAPGGSGPCSSARPLELQGFIGVSVYTPNRGELWIFDAGDLAAGPLCRLFHPDLQLSYTLHSAWLPTLTPRTSTYKIPPQQDYADKIVGNAALEALFSHAIYPHFP